MLRQIMGGLLLLPRGSKNLRWRRFPHSSLGEIQESDHLSVIQAGKVRFLYAGVSVDMLDDGNPFLLTQEHLKNSSSEYQLMLGVSGDLSTNSHHKQTRHSYLFEANLASGLRRNLLLLDSAAKVSDDEKLLSNVFHENVSTDASGLDFGHLVRSPHATFVDSRLLLKECLAAFSTKQLVCSLVPTSHAHEQAVRSSFQSFAMVDPSQFFIVHAPMATILHNWSDLCPFLAGFTAKEFQEVPLLTCHVEAQRELVEEASLEENVDIMTEREYPLEVLVDDDSIKIAKVLRTDNDDSSTFDSSFIVSIPKSIMQSMPSPPNDFVAHQGIEEFNIQARLVSLDNVKHVNKCLEWLLQDAYGTRSFVGLVCKYGPNNNPCLIQLSLHQRCLLITVSRPSSIQHAEKLRTILSDENLIKVGADIHKDSLALFHFLGLVTNRCIKITHMSTGQRQKKGVSSIFRDLFNWGWMETKKVVTSDWNLTLSLVQVKYAVLGAWSSRLVWARQTELWKGEVPSFSLRNMPYELLNYFGRSVFSSDLVSRKDKDTSVEMTGAKIEVCKHFLKLQQSHFKSRVLGLNSTVELRFKDGRDPEKYLTMVRRGNKVVLDPDRSSENPNSSRTPLEINLDVSKISKVLVDNSDNADVQRRKLEDVLYFLLCTPPACPPHILVALGCSIDSVGVRPKTFDLETRELESSKAQLNSSQLEAWCHILSNPLSAVIGPPGTGKTTLIKAIAKAWEHVGISGETLLCVAHQNVAVRHMAEAMVKEGIPGVLLLISEDYYVDWHEEQYTQVKDCVVISGPQTAAGMKTWAFRNKLAAPKVILCTLAVIGSQAFHTGLMGTKVSFLIIDECSQAAEGHLISNLVCLPHLQMLSVLGDPSQLPPYGKPLQSVFDLVSHQCDVKFLHEQYRMPHCIAKFVSEEFYKGRLKTVADNEELCRRSVAKPLIWVEVSGFPQQASGTKKSLCNVAEAESIVRYCKEYKKKMDAAQQEFNPGKLIILSLYEGQRILISKLLKQNGLDKISVYNVDSFQGQEANDVLISLVVGDRGSSFAVDRNRACVLLSRAKRAMYIFGNMDSVKASKPSSHAKVDNIWRRLANYCERNEWVAREEDFKDMADSLFKENDMLINTQINTEP